MENKSILKRLSLLTLFLIAGFTGALAQKLSLSSFTLNAGETKTVMINLDQVGRTIYGLQTDVVLSNGLFLNGDPVAVEGAMADPNPSFSCSPVNSGGIRVVMFSMNGQAFVPGQQSVIAMTVSCSNNFHGGTIQLKNSRLTVSESGKEISVPGCTAMVTTGQSGSSADLIERTMPNAETANVPETAVAFEVGKEYILYNVTAQKYFTQGNNWGTRGCVGPKSSAVLLKVAQYKVDDAWDGKTYEIENYVTNRTAYAWHKACMDDAGNLYLDQSTWDNRFYEIQDQGSNTYRLMPNEMNALHQSDGTQFVGRDDAVEQDFSNAYYGFYDDSERYPLSAMVTAGEEGHHVDWQFFDATTLIKATEAFEAAKDLKSLIEQAEELGVNVGFAVAVYNNLDATTEEINAAIDLLGLAISGGVFDNFIPGTALDVTQLITNPDFKGDDLTTGWSGSGWGSYNPKENAERYSMNFDTYQDIAGLRPGIYVAGVNAFYRAGSIDGAYKNYKEQNEDSKNAKFYVTAGDETFTADIVSPYHNAPTTGQASGEVSYKDEETGVTYYIPNNMVAAEYYMHNLGLYKNSLFFETNAGQIRLGMKKDVTLANDWMICDDFSLLYCGEGADAYNAYVNYYKTLFPDYASQRVPASQPFFNTEGLNYSWQYYDALMNLEVSAQDAAGVAAAIEQMEAAHAVLKENIALWAEFLATAKLAYEVATNENLDYNYRAILADWAEMDAEEQWEAQAMSNEELRMLVDEMNAVIAKLYNSPGMEENVVDVTHFIQNPGFDEDISFTVDAQMAKESVSTASSSASVWYYCADGTIYARNNEGNDSFNGFVTTIKGWTTTFQAGKESATEVTPENCATLKPEWVYFGSVRYDMPAGLFNTGRPSGGVFTTIDPPAKPEGFEGDDNTGVLQLRAGWTNSCSYKQTVNLPAAEYRLEYMVYNSGIATSNALNLCKVTWRDKVVADDTDFGNADELNQWVKHTIEFKNDAAFTIEFGFQAQNSASRNQPVIWIDGVKLYRIDGNKIDLTQLIAEANRLLNQYMQSSIQQELQQLVQTYSTVTDRDSLLQGQELLTIYINMARQSIDAYSYLRQAIDDVNDRLTYGQNMPADVVAQATTLVAEAQQVYAARDIDTDMAYDYGYRLYDLRDQLFAIYADLTIEEPGTFYQLLEEAVGEVWNVQSLKVSGTINDEDLDNIRELWNLRTLDLSGVTNLEQLPSWCFEYRENLQKVELPASLLFVGEYAFADCWNLQSVTCHAAVPPVGYDRLTWDGGITLYVPAISVEAYQNSYPWNNWNVQGIDELPESFTFISDFEMTWPDIQVSDSVANEYKPKVRVGQFNPYNNSYDYIYGALTMNGNSTVSLGEFNIVYDPNVELNRRYYWGDDHGSFNATLLNYATNMRADNVTVDYWARRDRWTFFSLPFDVKVSDIELNFNNTPFAIRKYDGAQRAAGAMNNTWVNMTADSILRAGEGYIIQSTVLNDNREYNGFFFKAMQTPNKNNIFACNDVNVALNEYPSDFAHNQNWNLVGNPYPCYYNIKGMQTTAPITVWNQGNQLYEAYSPMDDNYVLNPNEAFFVQRPVNQPYITFIQEARAARRDVAMDVWWNLSRSAASLVNDRAVFNFTLSDGATTDRTRVVFNESANTAYEQDKDASKFMSMNERVPQIYTVDGGLSYAINERPIAKGELRLGVHFGKQGTYTIAMNSTVSDCEVYLVDLLLNKEVRLDGIDGYTFEANEGTVNDRFCLRFVGGVVTGIQTVDNEAKNEKYYNLNGVRIEQPKKGLYLKDGKKVVVK